MGRAGRILRELAGAALLAVFVVACLRLGWWQWQRYQLPGGSLQNLGYTLQWPTFAIFAVFAVWRLRRLERQRRRQPAQPSTLDEPSAPAGGERNQTQQARHPEAADAADADDVEDADDDLAAYNRYLAQLNAKEQHRGR